MRFPGDSGACWTAGESESDVRRLLITTGCALAGAGATASVAHAAFPWPTPGNPNDYASFKAGPGQTPNDLSGSNVWKFAATPEPGNPYNSSPYELGGVRGAHLVDADPAASTAWQTTTGRPDVTIAVLDSGIKWNDSSAMRDLRLKTRLDKGEVPKPNKGRGASPLEPADCADYDTAAYDANGDGVFNVRDYACDTRVERDPAQRGGVGAGPAGMLDPQDVLIAFTDGDDDDGNGFADDIVGWDFLDNDNDPYDDVQYGHGTGEAEGSAAEVDNTGGDADTGSCPNCMVTHMRVGDSFIADASRFAQATIYATDNDALVVQEALGTLNNTRLARDAIDYAWDHGVTTIASAADEAAQHHNYVSSLPRVIVVNSIRQYDDFTPVPRSYLQFNGCTNFSSKVTLSIPSTSCSSDATGVASGLAGLVYSAALNARSRDDLAPHPTCRRTNGAPCAITPSEVQQIMASGSIGGQLQSDDVNFASAVEPTCGSPGVPPPGCTDPNLALQTQVNGNRPVVSPLATSRSYPARKGHDQFYGYGRVNIDRAVKAADAGRVSPEVEITSPQWFAQVDPGQARATIRGHVFNRGRRFSCQVLVAPGSYPNNELAPTGDFKPVASPGVCDGGVHTAAIEGMLAAVKVSALKKQFPPDAGDFRSRETGQGAGQTSNGRPNSEPYGFVIKVVAKTEGATVERTGQDQRNLYLHRDQDMLAGFPKRLPSDGESSPVFADLNGDNRNELIFATADGIVHAMRPNGTELGGWPVKGNPLPLHTGGRAFESGEVKPQSGAFLASVAVDDLNRDGALEVVGADFEGNLYAWSHRGERLFRRRTVAAYSGKPLTPFRPVRQGKRNRTQRGFLGSPVLADLDRNDGGRLEIVAAAMDRHVYAFNDDGSTVPGYPVLVVDRDKVESIDPVTHRVDFNANAGDPLMQGAIIDTPALADIDGDDSPEIVVGTNEEYKVDTGNEGDLNVGNFNASSLAILSQAGVEGLGDSNGRLFAIEAGGEPGGPAPDSDPFLPGWPVKIARLKSELLPIVGEGITGAPVVGPETMTCPNGGAGAKVGVIPDGGIGYILNDDGTSCQPQQDGKNTGLQTDGGAGTDRPAFPAVGHPAFGNFAGGVSFLAPATGVLRALDLAVSEYQAGGQDFLAAWDPVTGQFRTGFPARVNDLQFLTGPSVADIDATAPGEEMLGGTAYLDLQAFTSGGAPASAKWPKLTSDWMVANPLTGSFGTRDTDAAAKKVIVAMTRSGFVFAYRTDAAACAPASWPRFHHDNANSGYYDRDAVSPGKPSRVRRIGSTLSFVAPGDDLLCGTADHYEVVQANRRITAADFASPSKQLAGEPSPGAPGTTESFQLPAGTKRFVAVRAVDEQGNRGRFVQVTPKGFSLIGPPKRARRG